MLLRKLSAVLVGAWATAFVANLVLRGALGQEGPWVLLGIAVAGVVGGLAGVAEARTIEPMEPGERRDAILGWGWVIGLVVASACLYLPLPWAAIAVAAVLAATFGVLHALTGAGSG